MDAHNLRRHASDGAVRRDRFQDHAPGSNFGKFSDLDVANDLCTGANHYALPDLGVTIATSLSGSAQGDILQN